LRLTASDGQAQSSGDVKVNAFPVKLSLKNHMGGITRQVERLEDQTYVSRGRSLEIYDAQYNLLGKVDLDEPISEMVAFSMQSKNNLYVLTEKGEWWLLDVTNPSSPVKVSIQNQGAFYKNLRVSLVGSEWWLTALDKNKAYMWALNDPSHPQLKLELKGAWKDLKQVLLEGKSIYLVDATQLYVLDAANGILTASLPSGGNVNALTLASNSQKNFLVLGLGESTQGSQVIEGGLRVFEIAVGGKLINEKRFALKGLRSIEKMIPLQGTSQVLLGVKTTASFSLKMFDLSTESELSLDLPSDLRLITLFDIAVGKTQNLPVAILADASALKMIQLSPVGNLGNQFKASLMKNSTSTLAAGGIQLSADGQSLYLLDFGSMIHPMVPALLQLNPQDLSLLSSWVLGDGSYLSDITLTSLTSLNFASNLNDQMASESAPAETQKKSESLPLKIETQKTALLSKPAKAPSTSISPPPSAKGADGALRVFSRELKNLKGMVSSGLVFGEPKGIQNSLTRTRPLGMDAQVINNQVVLATAVGSSTGLSNKAGLQVIRFASDADLALLLRENFAGKSNLISLKDARDVKISSDGKWVLVAAGVEGLVLVDLENNKVVSRINPVPGMSADRVLLSHDQKRIFVSSLTSLGGEGASNVSASMHIYYFEAGKITIWGEITGLQSISLPYAMRSGGMALSEDDNYLYVANALEGLAVYNVSNPTLPVRIANLSTHGLVADVAVGQKYKDIYIADLLNGLEKAEFGF
ncbi:MAG: hypothetical protein JNK65_09125, partial [Deltaproteobacteria bacterium]|nr:hypothetical protein [Deltaproteobacteria bacterium]